MKRVRIEHGYSIIVFWITIHLMHESADGNHVELAGQRCAFLDSISTSLIRSIILRAEMALRIGEWGYTCRREVQGREDVLGRDIPLSLCRLNGHAHGSW